jgi:hypothetical protein
VHSSSSDSVQSFSEGEVINSEGEVVEEGDCPTTDEDSEMDSDSEVVWAKSARGTWGLGHTLGDKLYFIRDTSWSPTNWWPQQSLNLHPNPHPNMESSPQQSLHTDLLHTHTHVMPACCMDLWSAQFLSAPVLYINGPSASRGSPEYTQ